MTGNTVPSSTQRHGLTYAIGVALQLVLLHNGIPQAQAVGIGFAVAAALGGAARWLVNRF